MMDAENSIATRKASAETAAGEVKIEPANNKKYNISGCEVVFPHKAYGTQMSFMSKVISSLERSENALLEAPTGSGKTLSLLCSTLAWQEKEKRRFASVLVESGGPNRRVAEKENVENPGPGQEGGRKSADEAGAEGGAPPSAPFTSGTPRTPRTPGLPETPGSKSIKDGVAAGGFIPGATQADPEVRTGPPRIYYATRTHSQIQQVVAELKRCGYKPKMAILGSKQHYCVNSFVRSKPSIDEACEESLKVNSCKYFSGSIARFTASHPKIHDVEDLCQMGKQWRACPFFVSKELAKDADIVFGPYNYFIDPVIRRSMSIELDNAVFIFDEAHNIEDVCREGGSLDVSLEVVNDMLAMLTRACKHNMKPEVYDPLLSLVTTMKNWMMREDAILKSNGGANGEGRGGRGGRGGRSNLGERLWQGKQLMNHLRFMGLGVDRIEMLWDCYEKARAHDEEMMQEERKRRGDGRSGAGEGAQGIRGAQGVETHDAEGDGGQAQSTQSKSGRIGAMTLGTLSRIIQVVSILHHQCEDGGRDYRLVLVRTMDQDRGMSRRRQASNDAVGGLVNVTMSLWCLNPAIIFKPIATKSHSVVLTSGTLSPLDSFSSELGTKFQVSLEAPHVVNMQKQVLAGVLSTTSTGVPLKATYQNSTKHEFLDGVGDIVLSMCSTVPDGLLVFFPSYAMMDKLTIRWKETGTFQEMSRLKPHVEEPRSGGSEALKKTMNQYYRGINEGQGGLFFAVCRGKVSEGLDFSDQNARGVIVVGIPYPALKDSKVVAKKDYNDSRSRSSEGALDKLLTGERWYEQQAFRALNQALGRCIRHKHDYGTIILVDERFKSTPRQSGLSKWMRSNLHVFPDFSLCITTIDDFFKRLTRDPELNPRREKAELDITKRKDAIQMLMGGRQGARKKTKVEDLTEADHGAGMEAREAVINEHAASFQPAQLPSLSQGSRMMQAIESALRDAPIMQWVRNEVDGWTNAALSKGVECRTNAVERAMGGIMHVFGSAERLDFCWTDKIALPIPRGLQAIFHELLREVHSGVDSAKVDAASLDFGRDRGWDELDQRMLLQAMKHRYDECMEDIRHQMFKSGSQPTRLASGNGPGSGLGSGPDASFRSQHNASGCASDRRQSSVSFATPMGTAPEGTGPKGTGPKGTGPKGTGPKGTAGQIPPEEIAFLENLVDDSDSDW